jgi:hypothetical protein
MSDLLHLLEPMEQSTEAMLNAAVLPEYSSDSGEAGAPLNGALPLLDDLLSPATRCQIAAEEHARAAELHLEDAAAGLTSWRDRVASLRATLAHYVTRAV